MHTHMIAKNKKYIKYSKQDKGLIGLLMVLNVLIISFLVFSNIKLYSESQHISNQYLNITKEVREMENRNGELEELFALNTEEQTEKFLRDKGMYKKPGEQVVVIKRGIDIIVENEVVQQSASFWDKVSRFFKNVFGRD